LKGTVDAEEHPLKAIDRRLLRATAMAVLASSCITSAMPVRAQPAATDVGASMVQPPQPPASGVSAHNPDNMPIKRPQKPPRDPIARRPPASATQAK
jgi:hypothetical protein